MLNILYKDDAVIITIENATAREREVVELAEKVNQTVPNSVWSKFKNNQRKRCICWNAESTATVGN